MNNSKLLAIAFKELLQHKWRLFAYSISISVGIAALFATGSLKNDLLVQIDNETRSLVGGDVVIKGFADLPDSIQTNIEAKSTAAAAEKSFASMVVFNKQGQSRLVNVRAISSSYPLIGSIEEESGNSKQLKKNAHAVSLHANLKTQYGLSLNDSVRIGNQQFFIASFHNKAPGQTGIAATVAPTLFISLDGLNQTGLVRKGSRIRKSYYYLFADEKTTNKVYKTYQKALTNEGMRVENLEEGKVRLGRAYSNLFRFLNLAAFIALVLGGVGIGSAIDLFLMEKKKMVAVLKCIGFTYRQIAILFLVQVSTLGIAGSVIGVFLGAGLQRLMPVVFSGILIEEIAQFVHWDMILVSLFTGTVIALLFGLKTLVPLLQSTPMMALRANLTQQKGFVKTIVIIRVVQAIVLFLITWYLANDVWLSLAFLALLVVVLATLSGLAMGLRKASRKMAKSMTNFNWRYAINALYRPQNQTILLISTIGLSVILVLHLFFIRTSLVNTIQVNGDENRPNLIIFDIDKESVQPIEGFLKEKNATVFPSLSIVPMRMHALKGKSIFEWKEDSLNDIPNHIFEREYRVTERGELGENETLLEGKWTGESDSEIIPISIEENFSKQSKLKVGDRVDFNVFGSILKTEIAAIRQVDFTQMREAFTIVFPKGSLEGAPVMYAVSAKVPASENMGQVQNQLIEKFRNISVIDLDLIFESISEITGKIELAIQFMFSFSALTALIVLINSLFISRYQRIRENATLRTLGAVTRNLTRINVYEFLVIGLLAVFTGLFLSLGVSWALMAFMFKVPFTPDWLTALVLVAIILGIVVLMGVLNGRSLKKVPPIQILKGGG